MRVMVVIAAVPRARTVIAAAGVIRAVLVLVADRRVLADAVVAGAVLAAVPVVAALSADTAARSPAADQTIAAVELLVVVATGAGNFETAIVAEVLAALIFRHALVSTTAGVSKQAQERVAGAIVTADFAGRAILMAAAFIFGDTIPGAALPPLSACIGADA
jgi:hypothetical protein